MPSVSSRLYPRRLTLAILTLVLSLSWALGPLAAAASTGAKLPTEPRVAVSMGEDAVFVGANSRFEVYSGYSGQVVYSSQGSGSLRARLTLGQVALGDHGPFSAPLRLRVAPGYSGQVTVGSRSYRGELDILIADDGKLLIVNRVALEDYLLSVVPREMPSSYPIEALKAQAVAARSYAVSQIAASSGAPFDLYATTESQVYGGYSSEDPITTAVVRATAGQVLTHQGQVISAVYHASSGGHTEHSENVWMSYRAYLRGVPDFDQASPRYQWERAMTPAEVSSKLAAAGHNIGQLLDIVPSDQKGVSGRTLAMTYVGSSGSVTLRSEDSRRFLGLQSGWFDVVVQPGGTGDAITQMAYTSPVVIAGSQTSDPSVVTLRVGQAYAVGAEGTLYRPSRYSVLYKGTVVGSVEFSGRGWGHGVGMSQHGAGAVAAQGWTYERILTYYYQGTVLEQR
jgi:stage II sporulation protein D